MVRTFTKDIMMTVSLTIMQYTITVVANLLFCYYEIKVDML